MSQPETTAPGAAGAPATIVPRWEWRTFGEHFGEADAPLSQLTPDRVQESDEQYLLSLDSDASVKIRDGLMDVKHLEHVDGNGLEQWRPIMKTTFPLSADDVREVLSTLGVGDPGLERPSYTLKQLLKELVLPSPELRAVEVHKRRERHTLGGCTSEVTTIRVDRRATRTIAVESEDPARVIAVVRDLGLGSYPNVCLARGLKTLLGFEAVRYAVIDVGTNSVKFHVGERRPDDAWRTIVDRAEITQLGQGLEQAGVLQPDAIARTTDVVAAMADEARRNGVAAIAAAGTAGLRIATNASELIDAVQERCGVAIEVVSGEEEARLAYLAATSALELDTGSLVVFDTGGGSSQFTFGHDGKVDERFSVDVGAVRFAERYGLDATVSPSVLDEALTAIADDLARLDGRPTPNGLVGMGGVITNLVAVKHALETYDPDVVQGTVLERAEVDRQIELYRARSADERRQIVGLQPKRAEVILAGACIVRTVLDKLGRESLVASDRGLRHGLLVERFAASRPGPRAR